MRVTKYCIGALVLVALIGLLVGQPWAGEAAPAAPKDTAKPAAPAAEKKAPDSVVLPAPMGGVKFEHKLHSVDRKIECATCHHASKPEKALASPQQKCGDCHTKTAAPPMKTKLQAAFHNPAAAAGLCIDCHKAENAKGKKSPVKCMECHKKENK